MPKAAKSVKKQTKKTPAKKSITKSKASTKTAIVQKLMRQSSLMLSKKSVKKSVATPKKSKAATKDWEKGYSKSIQMFKNMPDYFQLNAPYKNAGVGTKLIHCGSEPSQEFRGVSTPLDFSTTYAQPAPGQPVVFDYTRCGNPTRLQLERQLASMEHGKFAFACASGIAACTTVMNLCQTGDHILCVDDVYGGTQRYLRMILGPNTGIGIDFNDFSDIKKFKTMIKPNTRLVWLETPTNPTLKCFDIEAIAKAIKEVNKNALLIIDNTFATAINTNPLLLGADIVTHSMTKYIGGHSDMLGGCLIMNDRALYDKLFFILKSTGTGLASFDCWLTLRSLKTLEVRVHKAQSNATAVAKALEAHKKVAKVVYPGLKSHP